jgi:hypothetical protein
MGSADAALADKFRLTRSGDWARQTNLYAIIDIALTCTQTVCFAWGVLEGRGGCCQDAEGGEGEGDEY